MSDEGFISIIVICLFACLWRWLAWWSNSTEEMGKGRDCSDRRANWLAFPVIASTHAELNKLVKSSK